MEEWLDRPSMVLHRGHPLPDLGDHWQVPLRVRSHEDSLSFRRRWWAQYRESTAMDALNITAAPKTRPSIDVLRTRRPELIGIAIRHGASNLRVFGSVARGDADEDSDIDLLVDVDADARGFAYFGMLEDLRRAFESALHHDVDVVDAAALHSMRERVLSEAVPLACRPSTPRTGRVRAVSIA